jgi:hypothetical protein
VGTVCMAFFFSALFMALPSWGFVNLWEEEWFWGWPRYAYWVGHSTEGDWSSLAWDYLIFDLFFGYSTFVCSGLLSQLFYEKSA